MNKVLACGEGPTDCGKLEYDTGVWLDGPVQIILRKIVEQELEIETIIKKDIFKSGRSKIESKVKLDGHALKAYRMCLKAKLVGADHVLCYVDADFSRDGRTREIAIKRSFERVHGEIVDGYRKSTGNWDEKSVAVVPATMIESWLLGDPEAYVKSFGYAPNNPSLPSHPEMIWGSENDPRSNYPKNYLNRVLDQYGEISDFDTFCCLAENIDIDTLKRTCPVSFNVFFDDVINAFKLVNE